MRGSDFSAAKLNFADIAVSQFEGAGHRLRHDPRAVAVLLGWLDRMRSTLVHPSSELV